MYDARTNLSLQVVEEVKRSLGQSVYRTIIPRNVRLGESPSHGLPINLYDPKSKGAEAYALLAEEVMERSGIDMAEKKRGLGAKGLGINALINTEVQDLKTAKSNETVTELDLDLIEPNRKQPRKYFDETALEELAASLKAYGMIQPIVVKKNGEYYEIIAGERRWRAAKIAGMERCLLC